jgi:hypothetical protein
MNEFSPEFKQTPETGHIAASHQLTKGQLRLFAPQKKQQCSTLLRRCSTSFAAAAANQQQIVNK